jgi:hypothetical protein
MRYRLLDFLPLLLALALVGVWFGVQQPPPWLSQATNMLQPAMRQLAPPPSTPPPPQTAVSRATAIEALCDPRQPRFLGSVAALKAQLGATMGEPVGCERQVDTEGNTEQLTSTGLAYYRRRLNQAAFTTGWEHWALVDNRLVQWAGTEVEPPGNATTIR